MRQWAAPVFDRTAAKLIALVLGEVISTVETASANAQQYRSPRHDWQDGFAMGYASAVATVKLASAQAMAAAVSLESGVSIGSREVTISPTVEGERSPLT